ncbi:MAG TPA: Rrf2 family transcriptional regulator [Pseudomonadales bacterium]|nr:Rrf2 family transcriptional regulator [Pseudomonadales bacterium]
MTALLDIALNQHEGPVCLPDIADRQEISLSYLEQLFARLRREGLVSSSRGRGGGYRLGLPADDLSIASIVDALGEGIDTTRCRGKSNCQQGRTCLSHHLWMDLSGHIHDFLEGISLADIIARRRGPTLPATPDTEDVIRILARSL